ncbi:MAG: BadF/BadG/BcrA/BcrD ATPase family protein [Actinomycetota bacterium]|nr:BadF/BadG/BcrA/BcrD ATPase family protein [Actinomycetota bacterium]
MKYILAVDGGGSKTTVQIAETNGKVVSEAISSSSNCKSVGINNAIKNLNTAIFDAVKNLEVYGKVHFISSCFGFAGNNTEKDSKIYKKIAFNSRLRSFLYPKRTIICNDTRIGLEAGSESKNKIIIIAGAGSNCFGINEEGENVVSTGWDYILADEGSGYNVGLKALRAVMRAYDGRGEETLLSKIILENLNLKEVLDIPNWVYKETFSKQRISSLAKIVCTTAQIKDRISIDILTGEAEEAVISVTAVANKLGFKNKEFDLVFVGGLFNCKRYFKNIVVNKLKEKFPHINFKPLVRSPVEGAIILAIKKLKDFSNIAMPI